jgi:hypothetical protein
MKCKKCKKPRRLAGFYISFLLIGRDNGETVVEERKYKDEVYLHPVFHRAPH